MTDLNRAIENVHEAWNLFIKNHWMEIEESKRNLACAGLDLLLEPENISGVSFCQRVLEEISNRWIHNRYGPEQVSMF